MHLLNIGTTSTETEYADRPYAQRLSYLPSMQKDIMLIITRKQNEKIIINKEITITISRIHANKVRIGIEGPRSTIVEREEIFLANHENQILRNRQESDRDRDQTIQNTETPST